MHALRENSYVSVNELAQKLSVSPLTIRRDLQQLEKEKQLERFHGGAAIADEKEEVDTRDEVTRYRDKIARYAAKMVEDGDTIFINTSSTALQMIPYITSRHVTVVTNNGHAIDVPCPPNVSIILSGGELRGAKAALTGEFTVNNIGVVMAKKSFLGCVGLSSETGMTTEILNEVNINQMMLKRVSGSSYILADHTKIGHNSSFVSCYPNEIKCVITDEKADAGEVQRLREKGVTVVQISLEEK